ncbi:MAG: NAD(P)H-dependent oxidoreductase [Aquamicrobium sp.]|nr:NAD(P)H-dependent oxidoreductase [Aquamicrobium sp.]
MQRRIVVIVGHPDPDPKRLCRALASSYAEGARLAGHPVHEIDIARLNFPFLRSMEEFRHGMVAPDLTDEIEAIKKADHIMFFFPLWLGSMPALLKAFLEQIMRPGIAFAYSERGEAGLTKSMFTKCSAHIVVTMGMPSAFYRLWYLGQGVASMRRGILNFVGIRPVRQTFLGSVEAVSSSRRRKWIDQMRSLGVRAR